MTPIKYYKDDPETKRAANATRRTVDGERIYPSHSNYPADVLSRPIFTQPQRLQFKHEQLSHIVFEDTVERMEYGKLDAAHENKRNGFVYVLSHPALSSYKVGHSRDPNRVVQAANRFCPLRAWKVEYAVYTNDRIKLEREFHQDFAHNRIGMSEFFLMNLTTINAWLQILEVK